ncbi:MAG: L-threonylcarbamoyladenylate synthase [Nevskiales bacterium]
MVAWHLRQAVRCLRHGGVLAYPTEAVWGLGCDPLNLNAVHRLLALKQRPVDKGLILIAAHLADLEPFLAPLHQSVYNRVMASWPGPVTWLLPAQAWVPVELCGAHDTLAVRVTAHPLARELCESFGGALVSSSANPARRPPARDALRVRRYFGNRINQLLPGATGGASAPSEIRDGRSGQVLRPG